MITAVITERRKAVRKQLATVALARPPKCQCNNCKGVINRFKCHECLRVVPWCYGGGDDVGAEWMGNTCNDCWSIITDSGTIEVYDAKEVRP